MRTITRNMTGVVQFESKDSDLAAHLVFANDTLEVKRGKHEHPTVSFIFKNLQGSTILRRQAGPARRGQRPVPVDLIARTVPLLLSLKLLMPNADPQKPEKRALKVKLLIYMITAALSQLNKAGEEGMVKMTKTSPMHLPVDRAGEGGPGPICA
jgi:hypothetical protein